MITRPMRPEDRRFIVPTWVRSMASARRTPPLGVYWRDVDRLLDAEATTGIVVASTAECRAIHAWAVGTPDMVHYAYVPPELRREGLARMCITALLGGYPERIAITSAWPFAGSRFQLSTLQRTAA